MAHYNFKKITVVPSAKDFVDIVLSRTQRKTPTVIHRHYKISRIRGFYMRKIKYTQQNYHDKLTQIITDFPRLEDIHPFYADLMNVLYDKDHYKLALGQINTARQLIDNVAKDYVRLMKHGDSLYRCKQLKRAALGRMCTIMKRQNQSLQYLEQVRQHVARLPSIDPNTRTLLVCGFPNVGKSSFMNKVTRADVEVQPYAFTTKSLFVGHMDYEYLRWQVVDTPGILDHTLEERNTIEMQAITALAHLRAAILYIMDISEQCGHTLEEQIELFNGIKPLFANKPLIVVLNKVDVIRPEELTEEKRELLKVFNQEGVTLVPMSTVSEEGIMTVRTEACDQLLAQRVQFKMKSKKAKDVMNRLHVAMPTQRDHKERPPCIPQAVLDKRQAMSVEGAEPKRKLAKDLENELGEDYYMDLRQHWDLKKDEEKHDIVPEIYLGKNVADFIDPDIMKKLEELEKEEELREAAGLYDSEPEELDSEQEEIRKTAQHFDRGKAKKKLIVQAHREMKPRNNSAKLPRSTFLKAQAARSRKNIETEVGEDVEMEGIEEGDLAGKRSRSQTPLSRKRKRAASSGARSLSRPPRDQSGINSPEKKKKAKKLSKVVQRGINRMGKAGEADRKIATKMPKHMFAGKRKMNKVQRR
ncbi:nucleolar GTP-binding protein 1-like [Stylophora pistillata]|uniref:nucleolar GTP-binding protein 1-like n=2 Tax=Stylophora pistillata TaxID=50429 RepID=UPI000C0399EA|nr:nucleolar GTP-binding protein 1-like [Stylophora pistillata]